MSAYIRRLVSGNKARFKDGNLNLELDLVYVTDQVIVMGYPANGIEGLYRNRREDAQKFLTHRHGKDFWVFNFCPVKENSYPASVFDGRVSRYPFPDHHAPPLALLPLAVREMCAWVEGHSDRVVVLHCKAGKGRSGTLACSYLLSLEDSPTQPRLQRSYSTKQWAKLRADKLMQAMPNDDTAGDLENKTETVLEAETKIPEHKTYDTDQAGLLKPPLVEGQVSDALRPDTPSSRSSTPPSQEQGPTTSSFTGSLKNVLDLHTSRRMKNSPDSKPKQGVSIPSQRRWLYYWSLLLTHQGPAELWPLHPGPSALRPKVRFTQIKIRMKEMSGIKMQLVKVANMVIDSTNMGKSGSGRKCDDVGHLWVSLARYDDELVEKLESWECRTRDENGHMGKQKPGTEQVEGEDLSKLFADQRWDKSKMVHSFARMGTVGQSSIEHENTEKDGKFLSFTLLPLSDAKWARIREKVEQTAPKVPADSTVESETTSITDATQTLNTDNGIIVDAGREVRVKLYMGQVFMGWIWFIPMFHMPQASKGITRFLLTRKEVDFPLGVGSAIVDVEISLEACEVTDTVQPPARQTSEESHERGEPAGVAATLQATQAGGIGEAVEAKQAAED